MTALEQDTLTFLLGLLEPDQGHDWRQALNTLVTSLRKGLVFDNLALYVQEDTAKQPEVVYARGVGRGRSAEADASWGEEIASQVISSGRMVQRLPSDPQAERVRRPHLLGLPLHLHAGHGALVFVRFGGPEYEPGHILRATLACCLVTRIYENRVLHEQGEQLDAARHRAQLQDDFIATISHDLRTPIGFIKGYTTSLLRPDTTWNPETQREFLTVIDEESDHLMLLIDRMLDSARLQNGMMQMEFQPLRLESLIRDVTQRITARHPELVVHLRLKKLPPVRADSIRLAEVFDNLYDNAMKYAPGSSITIASEGTPQGVKIMFSDQGPGIPAEHLPYLFERFYRASASSSRGTGLGLFICREIVRAHGGTISVERSLPGKGTMFSIELPAENRQGGTG